MKLLSQMNQYHALEEIHKVVEKHSDFYEFAVDIYFDRLRFSLEILSEMEEKDLGYVYNKDNKLIQKVDRNDNK